MIGLLFKDLLIMKKAVLRILVIMAIYVVIFAFSSGSSDFISVVIIILASFMTMNAFSYDEISKWNYYALSLPITKKQLVLTRYILSFLLNVCGFVAALLSELVHGPIKMEPFYILYIIFSLALVLSSLLIPLLFKFGTQKARIWAFMICLLPTLLILLGIHIGIPANSIHISDAQVEALIWLALPAAFLLFGVSYLISCHIMQHMEL